MAHEGGDAGEVGLHIVHRDEAQHEAVEHALFHKFMARVGEIVLPAAALDDAPCQSAEVGYTQAEDVVDAGVQGLGEGRVGVGAEREEKVAEGLLVEDKHKDEEGIERG